MSDRDIRHLNVCSWAVSVLSMLLLGAGSVSGDLAVLAVGGALFAIGAVLDTIVLKHMRMKGYSDICEASSSEEK